MKQLCDDALNEYRELADCVRQLSVSEWQRRTDFFGWTVQDEIAHLLLFDELAVVAADDASAFRQSQGAIEQRLACGEQISEIARREYAGVAAGALVSRWERAFTDLLERFERLDPVTRLPWFGPDMSARSFVTARLMETWAHGQDIYDALGVVRRPTPRLKHIAHLGVSTFRWSYVVRGQQPPEEAPRVELRSGGDIWTWNEGSRSGAVRGPAMDFCLVVTQRRNLADTALETTGLVAAEWMRIAQCFAGPPEQGPAPGARKTSSRD